MLNPIEGKFIFINPLVEGTAWWHDTRAAPTAEAFKPKSWKKKQAQYSVVPARAFGEHRDHPRTAQPPHWLRHQDRPDGSSAGQRIRRNTENRRYPAFLCLCALHQALPSPSRAGKELLGLGHDPRLKEVLGGLPAERQRGREEMMNNSELVVLNLMHFGISL